MTSRLKSICKTNIKGRSSSKKSREANHMHKHSKHCKDFDCTECIVQTFSRCAAKHNIRHLCARWASISVQYLDQFSFLQEQNFVPNVLFCSAKQTPSSFQVTGKSHPLCFVILNTLLYLSQSLYFNRVLRSQVGNGQHPVALLSKLHCNPRLPIAVNYVTYASAADLSGIPGSNVSNPALPVRSLTCSCKA